MEWKKEILPKPVEVIELPKDIKPVEKTWSNLFGLLAEKIPLENTPNATIGNS